MPYALQCLVTGPEAGGVVQHVQSVIVNDVTQHCYHSVFGLHLAATFPGVHSPDPRTLAGNSEDTVTNCGNRPAASSSLSRFCHAGIHALACCNRV